MTVCCQYFSRGNTDQLKYIKRKKEVWKRKESGTTMTDEVSNPTPELLEKVSQTATLHEEL